MNDNSVIPQSYQKWRECITIRCGIPLTDSYIQSRLTELRDVVHPKTAEFESKYGNAYLQQIIMWFEKAAKE